ncbi:MAG: chromosome condensation protein CrcB [Bacteroidetes bacterium 4572_77]|nr:MAG: chromosome condensation protein CrcB [Bacteroidetes bacterium 4572_77]
MKFLYLALGGSIGAILRYLVTLSSVRFFGAGFPLGTLAVNMLGSFFIGFAFVFFGREQMALNFRIFLFIGIFGSFTTFSTYMFESIDFIKNGAYKLAFFYMAISNILGLLLVYFGIQLGEYLEK